MIQKKKIFYYFIVCSLITFFFADSATKILAVSNFDFSRVSLIVRALFQAVLIFLIIVFYKKKFTYIILSLIALFWIHFIGQFSFGLSYSKIFLFENINLLNKYSFIFLLAIPFIQVEDRELRDRVYFFFKVIILINCIATLAGFVLGIKFFEAYYHQSYRFGYNGLIPKQNEATLFFMISLSFAYYAMIYHNGSKRFFFLVLAASMLSGTKGIYFYILSLICYHAIVTRSKLLISGMIISSLVIGIKLISLLENSQIFQYFIYQQKKVGFFSMLLSGRDQKMISNVSEQMTHWNFFNFLFGGTDVAKFTAEMDFVDLFSFFGIIGSTLYLVLFYKILFAGRRLWFKYFFVANFFLLSFLGGHFLYSAVNAIYLLAFAWFLKEESSTSNDLL